MRSRHKEWQNKRHGWDARIIWYQGREDTDIRLQMEDCERREQYYPKTRAEADHVWQMFKQGAGDVGQPFLADLLELLQHPKFKKQHSLE